MRRCVLVGRSAIAQPRTQTGCPISNGVPDISSAVMAVLHQIWIKRAHRGKMDLAERATLVAGRGISGNADQGGKRQVTLIDRERWHELMDRGDANLEMNARRANLVIDSVDLFDSRGKTLRI